MASTDARPMPLKNTAYRVYLPILDADGDLVTGATGLDSEISKDGGTFADCTNEATEIATSSGMYYLDLTSTEMNADAVCIIVKTSSSGAKTTPIVLYPAEATDIPVNVTAWNGTAVVTPDTAGYPKVTIKSGTGTGEVSLSGGKALLQNDAITAAVIATNAIDADAIATDAVTELQSGLATSTALSTVSGLVDDLETRLTATRAGYLDNLNSGVPLTSGAVDAIWDEALAGHTTAGTAGKQLSDAGAGGTPPTASDVADAVWEEVLSGHTTPGTAGYQLDDLSFVTPPTAASIADAVWDEAMAGHNTTGSAGLFLYYAASYPDLTTMAEAVWEATTAVYFGAGTMGKALGDLAAGSSPADIADAVWDEALSGHLTAGSAGKALDDAKDGDYIGGSSAAAMGKAYQSIIAGQFVTGTLTATSASTNLTGYGNDTFNGRTLTVISGTRTGEQTTISDHVETNGVLTFVALTGAPANGDEFVIA